MEHASRRSLIRLFSLNPGSGEQAMLVGHVSNCRRCWGLALKVVFDLQAAGEKLNFKDEPRRSLATLLKATCEHSLDRLGAKGRLATLRRLSHADRLDVLRTTAVYRTWSLFDVLHAETTALGRRGAPETEEIGRLAFALIELLDRRDFPAPLKMDFRAEIWNEVGNGRRVRQDWRGASTALQTAAEHLREGTGDPLPVARRYSIQSSLALDTGHIEAALKSAALARGIYEEEGDKGSAVRSMIQEADPLVEINPPRALAIVESALEKADETDTRSVLSLRSMAVECLIELDRPSEALVRLEEARPLYCQFDETAIQIRVNSIEARLLDSLGRLREAESLYKEVAARASAEGRAKDSFIARLMLISFYVSRQRLKEAHAVCVESIDELEDVEVHDQMRAVWRDLAACVAARMVDSDVLRQFRKYLSQHWNYPAAKAPSITCQS